MMNFSAMGLSILLLAGCAASSAPMRPTTPDPGATPVTAAELVGKWLMVSCYVNARGCHGVSLHASKADCFRARKAYDSGQGDRKAACKRADEE